MVKNLSTIYKEYEKNLSNYKFDLNTPQNTLKFMFPELNFPHLVGLQYLYPGISAQVHIKNFTGNNNLHIYDFNRLEGNKNFINSKYKIIGFKYLNEIFKESELYYFKDKIVKNVRAEYILKKNINGIEINVGFVKDKYLNSLVPTSLLINSKPKEYNKFIEGGEKIDINLVIKEDMSLKTKEVLYISNNKLSDIEKDLGKFKLKAPDSILKLIQDYNISKCHVNSIKDISMEYRKDKKNIIKNPILQSIGKYFETEEQNIKFELEITKKEAAATKNIIEPEQ